MSIAREEALSRYPEVPRPTDAQSADYEFRDLQARAEELRRGQMRAAYVYARTAEPTEAEIEAALPELLAAYRQESDIVTDRDYVKRILEAARKAVTE